jgi:hypothetical protein
MFKHYLTYTLAQSFHRSCCSLDPDTIQPDIQKNTPHTKTLRKERLLRSSEILIDHFAKAIHTTDRKEESRFLAVTLLALRDCKESMDEWGIPAHHELRSQFTTLHGRMEQLVLKAAEEEGGQLRMLG